MVCVCVCLQAPLVRQFKWSKQADRWENLQHGIQLRKPAQFAYLHGHASHTTHTQNTPASFRANLCITLGTLWVPVSGKCVWSDGEEWFWLWVKIINRQIHLHKSFQGFTLGQQLPAINITDNRLIFISNLRPFLSLCSCSPPCGVSVDGGKDSITLNQALTDSQQGIRQTFESGLIQNQIKFKTAF